MWRSAPRDSIPLLTRGWNRGPRRGLSNIGAPARATSQLRFGISGIRGPVAGDEKDESRDRENPDRGQDEEGLEGSCLESFTEEATEMQ